MGYNRITAKVNLDNIESNIEALYKHMPNPKPIMAVIKANGYGHGAVRVAKHLEKSNIIYGFAVSTADEAFELRHSGIIKPILILGYVFEEDYAELIVNDVCFTIFDEISAKNLSDMAETLNQKAKVHLKIDTGMSRIGVPCNKQGLQIAQNISSYKFLDICGVFTHFARADEFDKSSTYKQLDKFNSFVDDLREIGICPELVHCANSAAILHIPESHISIVRAGIVIYGLWPSDDMMNLKLNVKLLPAMSLVSHIVHIKELDINTPISYGGTYVTKKRCRIATVPVGYADGYPRSLSNKGYVLINGKKAPIVGRVCMDQMMVDVTDIEAKVLDEVVLLGKSGDKEITAEIIGELSGRFNYEFVCDITPRVLRIYE